MSGMRVVVLALSMACAGCTYVVPRRAREVRIGDAAGTMNQAELQQSLQRITGAMSQRLTQASDPLTTHGSDPRRTEQVLRRALVYQASALDIASGPEPEVNLLDMLVFVTLTRQVFEAHWLPKVLGPEGRPMLVALARSEAEVWQLADLVLNGAQKEQVRTYIRSWQVEHPDQVQVEAVRLSEFAKQAGQSAEARQTRGLVASVKLAAKTVDEGLMLGERALFLGQRVPFLLRAQVRLGAMEVLGDSLAELERAEGLLDRSRSLISELQALEPTLAQASELTSRAERVVAETQGVVDALSPLAEVVSPLLGPRDPDREGPPTRIEALAESAQVASENSVRSLRELRALASSSPAAWRTLEARIDASVRRWLAYVALVGVLWIATACLGYVLVRRALEGRQRSRS